MILSRTNLWSRSFSSIKKQIQEIHGQNNSPIFNVTPRIMSLCDRKLLHQPSHPLSIIKNKIQTFFGPKFQSFSHINPIVTPFNNFDALNISADHISRQPSDTYYITQNHLLRTHTSAHQKDNLSKGLNNFLVFGDVYRRDQIDKYHYPVFHQMEGVKMFQSASEDEVVQDLKTTLQKLVEQLFGKCQMRWVDAYFPFTYPSLQLQIYFDGKWVQMLGCGVIHKDVLIRSGREKQKGWAAGLGLQRFAMRLFKIPDVRLFWSEDDRFINQFKEGQFTEFKQFSKYPTCFKDISMWIDEGFNPNDLFGIIRQIGGDLIEKVDQTDTYEDKKRNRVSKTYKICFRSLERTLTNQEIVKYQFQIRDSIKDNLKTVQLR